MTRAAVVLIAAAAFSASAYEPPTSVEVLGGMGASLSEESAIIPHAEVIVDAPTYLGNKAVSRFRASVKLLGSPDSTAVDLNDIRTFGGVEANFGSAWRIGSNYDGTSETLIGTNGGFAVRRDSDGLEPHRRFPVWFEVQMVLQHRDEAGVVDRRIAFTYGANTMVTDTPSPRVTGIRASARLVSVAGIGLVLGLDAHRPAWGEGRGLARVTTSMAYTF